MTGHLMRLQFSQVGILLLGAAILGCGIGFVVMEVWCG